MSLQELVQLYAGLAQQGRAVELSEFPQDRSSAPLIAQRAAWMTSHILAGIVPPPAAGPAGRIAFKTGTSYGHRDAWAIGFDGRYVVGVWTGRPDGTAVPGTFGVKAAAPLLFEVFTRVRPDPVPLPPPPADTLMVTGAQLPPHLQRFDPVEVAQGPELIFPPDGARLARLDALTLKLRHGTPPFTVLQNGAVVAQGARRGEITVPAPGLGFARFAVIDAQGRAVRATIEVR